MKAPELEGWSKSRSSLMPQPRGPVCFPGSSGQELSEPSFILHRFTEPPGSRNSLHLPGGPCAWKGRWSLCRAAHNLGATNSGGGLVAYPWDGASLRVSEMSAPLLFCTPSIFYVSGPCPTYPILGAGEGERPPRFIPIPRVFWMTSHRRVPRVMKHGADSQPHC